MVEKSQVLSVDSVYNLSKEINVRISHLIPGKLVKMASSIPLVLTTIFSESIRMGIFPSWRFFCVIRVTKESFKRAAHRQRLP